jgi:hypothetical protein
MHRSLNYLAVFHLTSRGQPYICCVYVCVCVCARARALLCLRFVTLNLPQARGHVFLLNFNRMMMKCMFIEWAVYLLCKQVIARLIVTWYFLLKCLNSSSGRIAFPCIVRNFNEIVGIRIIFIFSYVHVGHITKLPYNYTRCLHG